MNRLNLPIDCAYFVQFPNTNIMNIINRNYFDKYEYIWNKLHYSGGQEIVLKNLQSRENMLISVFYQHQSPPVILIREIIELQSTFINNSRWIFDRLSLNYIVLGETTMVGSDDFAMFNGRHVELFLDKLSYKFLPRGYNPKLLKILTGIREIDVFFNLIIKHLESQDKSWHKSDILDKMLDTVEIIRKWLDSEERRAHHKYSIYSDINRSNDVSEALDDLYSNCQKNFGTTIDINNMLNYMRGDKCKTFLLTDREKGDNGKPKEFPLTRGAPGNVLESLKSCLSQNSRKVGYINAANTSFSALSIPALAIIYQTIRMMDSIGNNVWPLKIAMFAIAFHFIATVLSLASILAGVREKEFGKDEDKVGPKMDKNFSLDLYNIKNQKKYLKYTDGGKLFVWDMNCGAKSRDKLKEIKSYEENLGQEIIKTAWSLYWQITFVKFSVVFLIVAVVLYAISSITYINN